MNYKVIDIEGVGEAYAAKLNDAGIETAEEYLEVCKTPAGRKKLRLIYEAAYHKYAASLLFKQILSIAAIETSA